MWLLKTFTSTPPYFPFEEGFGYEAWEIHKKGTIILRGSLIQNYRKPVGLVDGSKGYKKDYAHDERMSEISPPHFPEPLNTGWEIKRWTVLPSDKELQ